MTKIEQLRLHYRAYYTAFKISQGTDMGLEYSDLIEAMRVRAAQAENRLLESEPEHEEFLAGYYIDWANELDNLNLALLA